jgi:hypothetical protein
MQSRNYSYSYMLTENKTGTVTSDQQVISGFVAGAITKL